MDEASQKSSCHWTSHPVQCIILLDPVYYCLNSEQAVMDKYNLYNLNQLLRVSGLLDNFGNC